MKSESRQTLELQIGNEDVAYRFGRSRQFRVARILGTEQDVRIGVERVYLDRMIADPERVEVPGWRLCGAVSSILERDLCRQ